MSVLLMGKAFYTDLPSHLRLTLLAICDVANDDGSSVRIGQKHLAMKIGATDRSVRQNVGTLVEMGFLKPLGRQGQRGVKQYEINTSALPNDTDIEARKAILRAEDVAGRPQGPSDLDRKPTAGLDRKPVAGLDRKPTSGEPSVEPSVEPTTATPRRRDEIWDTFELLYGPTEPSPHPDHGRRNRAVKLARIAGASVEELARLHTWATIHRDESIQHRVQTAIALASNLGDLRRLYAAERGKNASDPVAQREVELDVDVAAHNAALEAADAERYGGQA